MTKIAGNLFLVFITLFTSCIDRVNELNYPEGSEKKLFIYSIISPEQNEIIVHVRRTKPYFNTGIATSDLEPNAEVILSDGMNKVKLPYNGSTAIPYYAISSHVFEIIPGKTYFLSVSTPDGLVATSHCTVPNQIQISSIVKGKEEVLDSNLSILPYIISVDIRNSLSLFGFSGVLEKHTIKEGDTTKDLFRTAEQYFFYPEKRSGKMDISIADYLEKKPTTFTHLNYKKVLLKLYEHNLYEMYMHYWRKKDRDIMPSAPTEMVNLDPRINDFLIIGNEMYLSDLNIRPGYIQVIAGGNTLAEGVDYTVDYSKGKITIKNEGVLSSGLPIRVFYDKTVGLPNEEYQEDSTSFPTEEISFKEYENDFSNIEGGVGIFGAYHVNEIIIP